MLKTFQKNDQDLDEFKQLVIVPCDAGEMGTRYEITNRQNGKRAIVISDGKFHIVSNGKLYAQFAYYGDDTDLAMCALVQLIE